MSVTFESDYRAAVASAPSVPGGWACELCGGLRRRRLHHWPVGDAWNPASIELCVWQCAACRLVCLHPVPTAHELPDQGDWWSYRRRRPRRLPWLKRIRESLRRVLLGSSGERLVRATHRLQPQGRLLEVGCGTGALLLIARRYYAEVVGIEPSPLAAATVRQRGLAVIESSFQAADLPAESFDVILMDAVIEHMNSPLAALGRAHEILRPGGVIVLRTPKFGGPAYRMHGRAWNGFRHGYHTFLFDGKSLAAMLEKSGFEVLRKPRRDRPLDDILVLWGRKTRPTAAQPDSHA